jgi:hypothetical protein
MTLLTKKNQSIKNLIIVVSVMVIIESLWEIDVSELGVTQQVGNTNCLGVPYIWSVGCLDAKQTALLNDGKIIAASSLLLLLASAYFASKDLIHKLSIIGVYLLPVYSSYQFYALANNINCFAVAAFCMPLDPNQMNIIQSLNVQYIIVALSTLLLSFLACKGITSREQPKTLQEVAVRERYAT